MARVNVYIPDELIDQARAAHMNVSELAQNALRRELVQASMSGWLDRVVALPSTTVTHDDVVAALDSARDELGW